MPKKTEKKAGSAPMPPKMFQAPEGGLVFYDYLAGVDRADDIRGQSLYTYGDIKTVLESAEASGDQIIDLIEFRIVRITRYKLGFTESSKVYEEEK